MKSKILPLDKILKSAEKGREYWRAEFSGKNESGFTPIGDKVLILPDQGAEMTAGGIHLTPEVVERHTLASETGVIIEIGEGAFQYHQDGSKWVGRKPSPGDHIYMHRYSGIVLYGQDQKFYRLVDFTCIGAIESTSK